MVSLAICASCSSTPKSTGSPDSGSSFPDASSKTDAKDPPKDAGHDAKKPVDAGHGCESCDSGTDAPLGHDVVQPPPPVDAGHDTGHDASHTVMAPLGAHSTGVTIDVKTATGTVTRTYDVTIPATCDSSHLVPLLFAFHGDGGNGAGMYSSFPVEAAAAAAGGSAIFVYPDGTNNYTDPSGATRAGDLYHDPGAPVNSNPTGNPDPYSYTPGQPVPAMSDEPSGNEDVDFFDTMVEYFEKTYCVDKKKIWITGMSSGGYLSSQFGRWRAMIINGTAPQSGAMPFGNGIKPSWNDSLAGTWVPPNYCVGTTGPVPAIIIHGLADGTVDPCNALEEESYWDTANGCADSANNCGTSSNSCTGTNFMIPPPAPTTTSSLNSDCKATTGCGANPVVLCQIPGMGHQIWANAPAVIWSFFSSL